MKKWYSLKANVIQAILLLTKGVHWIIEEKTHSALHQCVYIIQYYCENRYSINIYQFLKHRLVQLQEFSQTGCNSVGYRKSAQFLIKIFEMMFQKSEHETHFQNVSLNSGCFIFLHNCIYIRVILKTLFCYVTSLHSKTERRQCFFNIVEKPTFPLEPFLIKSQRFRPGGV